MGKFNIKNVRKKIQSLERERQNRIKASMSLKPLLKPIPSEDKIEDGILLFGKYRGDKVSVLLQNYESSAYVIDYLSKSNDLPKVFRNQISKILENFDPWGDISNSLGSSPGGLQLNVVSSEEEEEDIPW